MLSFDYINYSIKASTKKLMRQIISRLFGNDIKICPNSILNQRRQIRQWSPGGIFISYVRRCSVALLQMYYLGHTGIGRSLTALVRSPSAGHWEQRQLVQIIVYLFLKSKGKLEKRSWRLPTFFLTSKKKNILSPPYAHTAKNSLRCALKILSVILPVIRWLIAWLLYSSQMH